MLDGVAESIVKALESSAQHIFTAFAHSTIRNIKYSIYILQFREKSWRIPSIEVKYEPRNRQKMDIVSNGYALENQIEQVLRSISRKR